MEKESDGKIPSIYVKADSVPEGFYKAMKGVFKNGYDLRTEYDRKINNQFIDPPSKDARASIEINDPWKEPRFPLTSWCEIGAYIVEMLGAKDHLVVPIDRLAKAIKGEELDAKQWPYTYHQRLSNYPLPNGKKINQIDICLDRLAKSPITRRAVMQTGVPYIDSYLKEDLPCLREIQLRAIENAEGELVLGMAALWRSRDLFKAWCDNVIGITNLQRYFAQQLEKKIERPVIVGNYFEVNWSLHIYGQDMTDKGAGEFLEDFPTFEDFEKRCWTSEKARDTLIIPQLEDLLTDKKISEWRFSGSQVSLIKCFLDDLKSGKYLP